MMQITTFDIIKYLPFEEGFKKQLLENFDSLSLDQQLDIADCVWDVYDALCQMKIDENIELGLERAKNGEEKLDHDFYKRIKAQTEKELELDFVQQVGNVDLSETREALEKILKQTN